MAKKHFSISPKNKRAVKKVLDYFDQEDQKIEGDDIRGGNWTEYGGGGKPQDQPKQ